jgi:plasmid stabilization system protein ParE
MAPRRRRVVWTVQARNALNEALEHVAEHSRSAAQDLLRDCLKAASSLAELSHRGLVVEEASDSAVRQVMVQRYRLLYEVRVCPEAS